MFSDSAQAFHCFLRLSRSIEHPLIRPFGHLLPEGEAKNSRRFFHAEKIILVNEINSLKTLARLGEGGPR
ncbi:MAG: hypothetical protein VXB67_19025, partial [Deltaproteobacteria bacterium]